MQRQRIKSVYGIQRFHSAFLRENYDRKNHKPYFKRIVYKFGKSDKNASFSKIFLKKIEF